MHAILLSRVVRNGIWLVLALVCTAFFQHMFFTEIKPFSAQENFILGAIMLASAFIIELMPMEERISSFFRCSLVFVFTASIVLALLSQVVGLFIFHTPLVVAALLLFIAFRGITYALSRTWQYPAFLSTKVMLLGGGIPADTIRKLIDESNGRFVLSGIMPFCNNNEDGQRQKILQIGQDIDSLYLEAQKTGVQTIIVSFPERRGVMPVQQILKCRMLGMNVVEAQTFYERVTRKLYIENLKPSNIIFSSGFCLSMTRRFIKRTADIVGASLGLLILLPLFPLIALAIRLDSPGPVFFRQIRTGRGGKPFHIIKFRTMCNNAEKATGAVWACTDDPRITRVGGFLRKTRLDETPQLLNVLFGEMSLIGPRPERPEFIVELEKSILFYSERHSVKPGVTGWAQVRYPYGASIEDALEKLRYDLYYIKNQSLLLELEITIRTILVIFTGSGAR